MGGYKGLWESIGGFTFIGRSVVKKFLTTDFYIEYNRDSTNLNFTVRGWENVWKDGGMFTICSTILDADVI